MLAGVCEWEDAAAPKLVRAAEPDVAPVPRFATESGPERSLSTWLCPGVAAPMLSDVCVWEAVAAPIAAGVWV